MAEYMPCTHKVIGSTPIISKIRQSSLMAEHGNHTPGDVGSSPIFVILNRFWDMAKLVRHRFLKPEMWGFESPYPK